MSLHREKCISVNVVCAQDLKMEILLSCFPLKKKNDSLKMGPELPRTPRFVCTMDCLVGVRNSRDGKTDLWSGVEGLE